jgi:hypothetical protein
LQGAKGDVNQPFPAYGAPGLTTSQATPRPAGQDNAQGEVTLFFNQYKSSGSLYFPGTNQTFEHFLSLAG